MSKIAQPPAPGPVHIAHGPDESNIWNGMVGASIAGVVEIVMADNDADVRRIAADIESYREGGPAAFWLPRLRLAELINRTLGLTDGPPYTPVWC
jgi:hypothetical protein